MDGTILGQGTFTQPATAINQIIQVPSNLDWLQVWNYTQANQGTAAAGPNSFLSYWQRTMPTGIGTYLASGAAGAVTTNITTANAFQLYDPSGQSGANAAPVVSAAVNVTAVSNATQPAITCASTAGLSVGSIVRLSTTGQSDINGVDLVVSVVTDATHFTVLFNAGVNRNLLATAPGASAIVATSAYRIVQYPLFYPRTRYITNFGTLNGVANSVATSTAHGFTPGQIVRFSIPSVSGSVELNSTPSNMYQVFTIQSVTSDYNFTINPPASGVTAFTYPTSAQIAAGAEFPIVTPVGEDTANALTNLGVQVPMIGGIQIPNTQSGILSDATVNTGYLGMILQTGALLPAGVAGDVCYWVAGKSTYGGL